MGKALLIAFVLLLLSMTSPLCCLGRFVGFRAADNAVCTTLIDTVAPWKDNFEISIVSRKDSEAAQFFKSYLYLDTLVLRDSSSNVYKEYRNFDICQAVDATEDSSRKSLLYKCSAEDVSTGTTGVEAAFTIVFYNQVCRCYSCSRLAVPLSYPLLLCCALGPRIDFL